jgi:hypothetical protein
VISCKTYTRIGTVRNNVCRTLEKKTIIYAVFVDSEKTHPWSKYDITSTLDSIQTAIDWVHLQAKANNINLEINLEYAKKDKTIPFKEDFKYKTFSGTLFKYYDLIKGIKLIDEWSNNISKDVGRTLPDDTSEMVLNKNKSNDRERLIAKLRNQYETDNIALLFFINNYYENEISVAFHTSSSNETEYAVVSNKEPAVIAHEFLHLFGAWDLYISPLDRKIFEKRKKRKAMKKYPTEIMAFAYKNLDSLTISPLTKYLIGWDKKLQSGEGTMFVKRRWKLLEY